MRYKFSFAIILLLLSNHQAFPQNQESKTQIYSGVFAEYNTLILTHNLKLFSDFNYYNDDKVILSIQPGVEFIYSFPGAEKTFYPNSPYYDINLLGAIQLFPNYGISIKPFAGLGYRIRTQNYKDDFSSFNIKYGTTLQLNISEGFKIIGKIMNVPRNDSDDVPILLGVGFSFQLF